MRVAVGSTRGFGAEKGRLLSVTRKFVTNKKNYILGGYYKKKTNKMAAKINDKI